MLDGHVSSLHLSIHELTALRDRLVDTGRMSTSLSASHAVVQAPKQVRAPKPLYAAVLRSSVVDCNYGRERLIRIEDACLVPIAKLVRIKPSSSAAKWLRAV